MTIRHSDLVPIDTLIKNQLSLLLLPDVVSRYHGNHLTVSDEEPGTGPVGSQAQCVLV